MVQKMMVGKIIFKGGELQPRKFVEDFSIGQDLADFSVIKRIRIRKHGRALQPEKQKIRGQNY